MHQLNRNTQFLRPYPVNKSKTILTMAFKCIALFVCAIAVASAGLLPATAPAENAEDNFDAHPSYSFSYEVQDAETGDNKLQSETRDGDNVQGRYELNDADGYRRIVEYTVDGESGFNAVVRRERLDSAAVHAPALPTATVPAPQAPVEAEHASMPTPAPLSLLKPVKPQSFVKSYVQPANYIRTYTALQQAPTLVHQAPTLVHQAPTLVHHTPTLVHHTPTLVHQAPTLVHHHHAASHTLIHAAPSVHLSPATHAHLIHAAPATTLLRTAPTYVTTHHHAPALVKTSLTSPHVQYVY